MKTTATFKSVIMAGVFIGLAQPADAGQTDLNLDVLATGNHEFTADGETFSGYVRNDGGTGWLLVGRGRNGWEFDNDGQGAVADVGNAGVLGTTAAFSPVMYRDAIINALISDSGIDLTDIEIRIRRAGDATGTGAYQEVRWRPATQTTWNGAFDDIAGGTGYIIEHEILPGGPFGLGPLTLAGLNSRDTLPGGTTNGPDRIFTWAWNGHGLSQGFSYGQSVPGTDGNDPNTFMWENGNENHAIPYTEVYIRSLVPIPEPTSLALLGLGALGVLRRRRA